MVINQKQQNTNSYMTELKRIKEESLSFYHYSLWNAKKQLKYHKCSSHPSGKEMDHVLKTTFKKQKYLQKLGTNRQQVFKAHDVM